MGSTREEFLSRGASTNVVLERGLRLSLREILECAPQHLPQGNPAKTPRLEPAGASGA